MPSVIKPWGNWLTNCCWFYTYIVLRSNSRGSSAIYFNYLLLGLTLVPKYWFWCKFCFMWGVEGGHGPNGWFCCSPSTHTRWWADTLPCCPLCTGFLGSRPIYHVSVFGGAALHCLSYLFFRSRPVSSPHLSHYYFLCLSAPLTISPPPVFTSPSIAQSFCTPHLTKRTKR